MSNVYQRHLFLCSGCLDSGPVPKTAQAFSCFLDISSIIEFAILILINGSCLRMGKEQSALIPIAQISEGDP